MTRELAKDDFPWAQELLQDYPEHISKEEIQSLEGFVDSRRRAVALWREVGDIIWMRAFVVARENRYGGIGRKLLHEVEDSARRSGRKNILFVLHRNSPRSERIAEDFLHKQGYRSLLETGRTLLLDKNLLS